MNILGINYYFHDSSACLLRDGELVVAIEEERLNRDKHTNIFPSMAIDRCLEVAGLEPRDVDHIALSIRPMLSWQDKLRYAASSGRAGLSFLQQEGMRLQRRARSLARWLLRTYGTNRRPEIHFVEHHLAHVAGSFLASPYEEAALLGIDGSGEWATSFLGVGRGTSIRCYNQSFFPDSLGSYYEAVTEFCGFRPNYDEGKTMGLAPYGDDERHHAEAARLVNVDRDGGIHVDLSYFSYQHHGWQRCAPKFHERFGEPRRHPEAFADHHHDVAAAFQRVLEERALEMCEVLHRRSGCRHAVLSGGVALNSVMNGRIVRESPFDDIYVMPGAGDDGTCIGAAYYVHNVVLGQPRRSVHDDPYVGPGYDDAALVRALEGRGLVVDRRPDITADVAGLLGEGKIVGWFQGRMEFGPRALGNRSILANPTLPDMKDVLNAKVKHREPFRPFAPSAAADKRSEYFVTEVDAPFMLKVCDVQPRYRERLPAITHVDGTARLQTVHPETNPRYHALIKAFGARSGVDCVVNTSFNVMGQPIVESPEQAIDCYLGTGIEALALGDYLVDKKAETEP